jgi:hypothetical protein
MDDKVGVHVVDGAGDLPDKHRHLFNLKSNSPLEFVLTQVLMHVVIGRVFADEIDGLLIMEAAVQFDDMRMVHK